MVSVHSLCVMQAVCVVTNLPKFITLDVAGTLIKPSEPVAETYVRLAANHGAELDPARLGQAFAAAFQAMPPMAFALADPDTIDRLERGWWRHLVRSVTEAAGGVRRFDVYFEELYEHYRQGTAWTPYREVDEVLDALQNAGIRLAVISNFDSRLNNVLDGLSLASRFEVITYSTGARAAKPDPRIFQQTLEILGARPDETIHAGDNEQADYKGARNAGLHALLLRRGASADSLGAHEAVDLTALLRCIS